MRIESIQPHFANGFIKLLPEQRVLIEQLREFPDADHDDGPDALHMLWMAATTGNVSNRARAIDLPVPMLEM
jgi:predicted phage terminase large subunit-like protein